jgi:hypothetical protein
MSNSFHKILANKFNKKKTFNNDIKRIANIHKNGNTSIHMVKQNNQNNISSHFMKDLNSQSIDKPSNHMYTFHNNTSTNIDWNIHRLEKLENDPSLQIPKIEAKPILVPTYSPTDMFDVTNQNIPNLIPMDIFASDHLDTDNDIANEQLIDIIKKRNVKKIYHVYQEKYANHVNPTGFGDFIRSCLFIIQFCLKYEFEYEILINHPISLFLKNAYSYQNNTGYSQMLHSKVNMFIDNNWLDTNFEHFYDHPFVLSDKQYNKYIRHLSLIPVLNGALFSYNVLFPIDDISYIETDIVKRVLEPSNEMTNYVNETIHSLQLTDNPFIVIQIRSGDSYLKNEHKMFHSVYLNNIKNEIAAIISSKSISGTNILLLADNNEIKYLLHESFPFVKLYFKDITHLGEGVKLEREKVQNTLLDFYLMAKSSCIYSFTSYPHGSGFSYWCSKLYNIPYHCKFIQNEI